MATLRPTLALLALLALAACGPQNTAMPTLAPTVVGGETVPSGGGAPADDSAANPTAPPAGGAVTNAFSATVSGGLAGDMGRMIGVDVCSGSSTNLTYTNQFNAREGDPRGTLTLIFPPDTAPGTYTLEADPAASLPIIAMSVDDPTTDDFGYVSATSWTMNLATVPTAPGEAYSGTFEITLQKGMLGGTEAPPADVVTVTGQFTHVMDELCADG